MLSDDFYAIYMRGKITEITLANNEIRDIALVKENTEDGSNIGGRLGAILLAGDCERVTISDNVIFNLKVPFEEAFEVQGIHLT